MYRLLFLTGKFKGKRLTIQQGSLTIGRDPDCNIDLDDDDEVSRNHAVIDYLGSGPIIRDLGATNQVQVNQQPIKEHRLRNGDQIEIGRTIIEFQSGSSSQPPRQRRKFSKMQAMSFAAIGIIILIQLVFVIVFPIWQKTETVPVIIPDAEPPPAVAVESPAPSAPPPVAETASTPDVQEMKSPLPVVPPEPVEPVVPVVVAEPAPAPAIPKEAEPAVSLPGDVRPVPARDLDLVDPLVAQSQEMLNDARAAIAQMNYGQADSILERAQMMSPDYIPVWRERAKLYETRKLYRQAGEQWDRVVELTRGTPAHAQATSERNRVALLERVRPAVKTAEMDGLDQPAGEFARNIRIVSVERERFQSTEEFDDMRLIRITLRPRANQGAIVSSQIKVVVNFYDRVEGTDILAPSRALTQLDGTRISGPWPPGESRTVTAAYILRKGFREQERAQIRERRVYEGYRVSVYYQGELQDESAMPRRILDLPRPPVADNR